MNDEKVFNVIKLSIAFFIVFLFLLGSWFTVEAGNVAVKLRFGKIVGSYTEGLHFKWPLIDSVEKFSVKIKVDTFNTEAFSKDLQTVKVSLAINHRIQPDTVVDIYRNLGTGYVETIIKPLAFETSKAIIAKYSSDSLLANREQVVAELNNELKAQLNDKKIIVSNVSITDFDFTPEFLRAVEAKQIAEQDAKRAANLVDKAKKEAEQKVIAAKAEAESLALQKMQVTPETIKLRQVEAYQQAIQKWDGRLPQYVGGDQMPFVMVRPS